MASLKLKCLVVPPKGKHTATVIFLHGLGDSGAGWHPVAEMMQQDHPALGHIRWVLPHAPVKPVTINFGMQMPAWYDLTSLTDINAPEDEAGLLSSASAINEIIASEIDTTPDVGASRIVLGGFSQGGAQSLFTGLSNERKLAGIIGLSSYLPLRKKLKDGMMSEHAKQLPIFMGHGTADPVVRFKNGHASYQYLLGELGLPAVESSQVAGAGVRFERYNGLGHSTDSKELEDFAEWLKAVVPQEKK